MSGLVAYKNNYAELIGKENNKFIIKTADNKTLKVREKDFKLLHPEFSTPDNSKTLIPDLSVLDDLIDENLDIKELSEWLFGEYTPSSAWQAFLLITDGLYFYFAGDKIVIRPQEQVIKIKQKRAEEQLEQERLNVFIENYNNKDYKNLAEDIIIEIKKVALNNSKNHKIFKLLGITPNPENALQILHQIGHLTLNFNPYPKRYKIADDEIISYDISCGDALDLTHLKSYAIDNTINTDADDAISIDGDKIWVHIADIESLDNDLISYAKLRVSNLYLPDSVYHMLPENISDALALNDIKNAFSIGFKIINNEISDITINKTKIKIINITYADADNLLETELKDFYQIATTHIEYRKNCGAFNIDLPRISPKLIDNKIIINTPTNERSRFMIAEFMVLAGRVIAKFAQDNNIPIPYICQVENNIKDEFKNKELSLSEKFNLVKQFPRSTISTKAEKHSGMGLDCYTRITSPLRRFLDFITQKQIYKFLRNEELFSEKQIKEFISINNKKLGDINKCVRDSETYYKLIYLTQNQLEYDAVVINKIKSKSIIFISNIGLITEIKKDLTFDEKIKVQIKNINIYNLTFQANII